MCPLGKKREKNEKEKKKKKTVILKYFDTYLGPPLQLLKM